MWKTTFSVCKKLMYEIPLHEMPWHERPLQGVRNGFGGNEEDCMNCPECGKEMTEGFLQGNTNSLFFNMERQKSAVCAGDGVSMAQGRLRPVDFGGFICKECGIVVYRYKNSLK